MPIGPFGEIIGTTGTLDGVAGAALDGYKSKVIAPRNPKLVRPGEHKKFKMKPSQFMFQMSMNTEQKLANMHTMDIPQKVELLDMAETTHQKVSNVNIDEPMFQPFPSEVIFQNFEPFETYEVPFVLRNNDKVPRLVKVSQENSPYFKIISPHNVGHKVGPGLPTTFRIQFTPEEKKDYYHQLLCTTEREKFVVPVKAIGARAVLDFPDEVTFNESPVKYSTSKTLLVRNVGNNDAKFKLETEKPFSVSPINGTLSVNECVQITVDFNPQTVGDHHKDLVLSYHTGENIYIGLYGAANDALVRLDKNSIRIENTFISMANQRTVTISNRSNVIAHYRWTQYATQEEEHLQKTMFCDKMVGEEAVERDRFLEECIADPSLRDKMSILSRTFQNRKRLVQDDRMLFVDDVIKIEPVEGDIWPNSSAEVQVIFKPEKAEVYNRTAFCDITGRESRLPLRIRGDGIGPKVAFSYDDMDMGNIFVNSTHTYEVVLVNKGDIDAIFSLIAPTSVFGPCFQFNPSEGIVMPDGHQAIQITFSSAVLGDFKETFEFQVDGSPQKLELTFMGSVIGPTFHFDEPKLKFGTISYGFVSKQTCNLVNTALVPMKYTLRVPGDGIGESIASTSEYDSTISENGSTLPPKEFEITPCSGTVEASSEVKIEVAVCSNTVKKYELALVVDVEGVGDEVVSLPITAKCIVPHITVLTPMLDYGRCFLRHPYEHHVKLQNDTDLPAKYELVPQVVDEFTPITYTSPQPKGILEPHSVTDVPMVITPQGLEELEVVAQYIIFGNPENALVQFTCNGEGPVVHVMPLDMDWGTVPVLVDMPRIVRLSNESLIPAKFTTHMVRPGSVWRVEPSQAEIPPEKQIDIVVTACVDDCVRFQDKLQINFLDGPSRSIPVMAYGQGTTITSDPPMTPTLNLGPHFSKGSCKRTFTLTNKGRRHQSIVWNTDGFPLIQKPKKIHPGLTPINPKDMKFRDMPPPVEPPKPVFTVDPHRMELHPGQSCDIVLEGTVDSPRLVKEKLLCHAIIGRAGGKELIMKVQVNCEFISPLLEFSTDNLAFRVDKLPASELEVQKKELEITNVSSLPLTACLSLPYPFQLLVDDGDNQEKPSGEDEMYLGIGETRSVKVQFDPAYKEDHHIRIIDEVLTVTYKEHPHQDNIALRGEVYFPNLDFEKTTVDFGCILNDTEVTRYVNITNNSPMDVKYRWSFLIDGEPIATFRKAESPVAMAIEDMDGESQRSVSPGCEENIPAQEEVMEIHVAIEGAESPCEGPQLIEVPEEKEEDVLKCEDNKDDAGEELDVFDATTPRQQTVDNETQMEPPPEKGELDQLEKNLQGGPADGRQSSLAGSRLATPKSLPPINPALAALLAQDAQEQGPLGVEEIFDILPLYGTLKPGDMEQVTLTFYGHAHIGSQVKAICEVEGGPTYELLLKGEASLVQYQFDCLDIDYGKIMYDQVAVAEIALINTGHVGLEFHGIGMDPGMAAKPKAGVPVMIPHAGFIEPHSEQTLTLKFLPGAPERFHKSFQIQVAHFEPDTINMFGEGVFPRISLDLPRSGGEEYEAMVKEARENLTKETKKTASDRPMSGVSAQADTTRDATAAPSELEVQMEVERQLVQEFAQVLQNEESNRPPDVLEVHTAGTAASTGRAQTHVTSGSRESKRSRRKPKPRPRLPEYVLDFGHVVLGTMRTHIVRATNTGWFPTSFSVDHDNAYQYGFNIELNRVKQLPGAPDHETVDFVISFDPRGANLGLGETETLVPINVVGGPQIIIRLKANVTMPDMQISTDVLDFSDVKCGECKVITVQLHNHKPVKCDWNSLPTDKDRQKELEKNKIDKHVPMHLRRKMRQDKAKPRSFEMMPPTGTLLPGHRQNVQVKFMPTEEKFYENRIAIRIAQSSQRLMLLCRGQGLEPHIEFDHNLIEFGPVLPHSAGDEQEVIIRNPSSFPIEIYNLEFDKGYLEEEKILRLMKGYDEYNTILLPPRMTGEKLPSELTEYYEEQMRKLEEAERQRREAEEAAEAARREQQQAERGEDGEGEAVTEDNQPAEAGPTDRSDGSKHTAVPEIRKDGPQTDAKDEDKSKEAQFGVGELEVTPVSAAIARHLGIDLSPDGKAARNRRGISIIVHGAPLSGKTASAVALAKRYEAALLTVDGIVLEAISNGNTPAGLRARELCSEAAQRRAEELRALEGTEEGTKAATGGLSVEALTAHTQGTGSIIGQIATAQSVAHSLVSNRKTSTISDQKSKDKHHSSTTGGAGAKTAALTSSGEGGSQAVKRSSHLKVPKSYGDSYKAEDTSSSSSTENLTSNSQTGSIFENSAVHSQDGTTPSAAEAAHSARESSPNPKRNRSRQGSVVKNRRGSILELQKSRGFDGSKESVVENTAESAAYGNRRPSVADSDRGSVAGFHGPSESKGNLLLDDGKHGTGTRVGSRMRGRKSSLGSKKSKQLVTVFSGRMSHITESNSPEVPSSPQPLAAPIARRLSISASIAGEQGLLSCVLPEDLLIEILAERLMLNDCHRGVVFDGLETLFSQNQYTTCHAILKALNNRKYIFMVTLRLQYAALKEKEKAAQEEAEVLARQREEEERVRLEEMSEDEYDALADEEKASVDRKRLEIKKERLRREQEERQEREKREREAWEAEQRRQEEEKAKGKKKKDAKDAGKKTQGTGGKAAQDAKSVERVGHNKSQEGKKAQDGEHNVGKSTSGGERPESHTTEKGERGESAAEDGRKKKEKSSKDGKRPVSNECPERKGKDKGKGSCEDDCQADEQAKDTKTEADLLLMQRFRTFEHSFKEITDLIDHWERATASIHPITPSDGQADQDDGHNHPPSGRKPKKGDKHDKGAKEADKKADKASKEAAAKDAAKEQAVDGDGDEGASDQAMQMTEEERREKRLEEGIGVPHMLLECTPTDNETPSSRVMEFQKLPTVEEVLDGLGLGPHGPPIPPPAAFSVVPYPVKRHAPPGADGGHYTFVASSPDDPNICLPDDKSKEEEADEAKSVTPDGRKEETHPTPTKGNKGSKSDKLAADKKDKRKTSAKSRAGRRSSMQTVSPPPGAPTPASETEGSTTETALQEAKTPKLQMFRWVIGAESEVVLRLRFTSEDLGQFDQTLNFEILGTRRRYQLYCRGICAFPTISREPRIVFPHRKKSKKPDEIVQKKYILTNETFEFGPLLVGKSRDKYKEGKYPENMEKLTVLNTSPLDADISFCFLNDSKGETYLLDPPTMILKPNQSQELSIWSYPKVPGVYEDALVCCIKENPEPIMFKLLSYGVQPELELDKKVLHFDKVLLHRKDTKTLYLRNSTLLPVAWRLNLLENLGDDFSVSQESGIIEPKTEFALHAYFRAMKPVNTNKKAIRLEVSDADNIRGLLQSENIQVHAEAYDVALDMSFPKGADGGIDFDVIRVMDEQKQTCSLKNKGKYDIGYSFTFEPTDTCPQSICDMFSVIPNRGTLSPVDRPAQVQVIFRSTSEVHVKEQPILRCQVIEPNIAEEGETIASIPIKLTVKSVFSKYKIFPVNDINFGAMLVNSRKTRTFTIENRGERFDFKYTITRVAKETTKHEDRKSRPMVKGDKRSKSRDGSSSGRSGARPKRAESISENEASPKPSTHKLEDRYKRRLTRQEMGGGGGGGGTNQSRLMLGMFNVFPAFGYILPGGHQIITVDCVAENPGKCEEEICIDITGRDPSDHPSGIPYKLIAEACVPSINVNDLGSIFEEHRVCKNLSMWQHANIVDCGGVFGEDENKFIFNNVLVGAKARARFKITNTNKVPCDVLFSVKPVVTKSSPKTQEVFEVEPPRAQIAAHSHIFAIVSFTPVSMQHYSALFEAAIEGVPQNMAKGRNLMFEVAGEGNLPRISILKPSIHNKKGQSLLLFKRLLVGRSQHLPIHIRNDGTLPSKVDIDMVDPDSVFTLQPKGSTQAVMATGDADNGNDGARKRPHAASVIMDVGETAVFDVIYQPNQALRSQGQVRLTVVNNQYEDSVVQLVGEGYFDDLTLENIPIPTAPTDPELEDGNMADDDVQAAKCNHIKFGDCFINEPRTLSFSLCNHSEADTVRFAWPDETQLKFSPQLGHLHSGCSKDIVVTFQSDAPVSLDEHEVLCKITKITFDKPKNEVADWDDRVKTVKWVDASTQQVPSGNASDSGKPATPVPMPQSASRPVKKKVVETEPEPVYQEVPDSGRTVDLLVSAHADYSKFKCKVESVHFRDTLMLQTRIYEFQLSNKGTVRLDYNWQVLMESLAASTHGPRSVTFAADSRPPTAAPLVARSESMRPNSSASSIVSDVAYTPFDIEPTSGTIAPGKKANFSLKFSPLDVNDYDARVICSIPNLEEGKQGPVVALKARSLMPYCHFELEDSDYIRSARRNPELRGPGGAPPGTTLDPNTRVIELKNVGVGVKNLRRFDIVNPTNQDYTFTWTNEDEPNPKKACDFNCINPHGVIRSGKKTEVIFDFVSSGLDLVESFWRFSILEQNISVPFLLVGTTIDPAVSLDRSHLNFKSLLIGHEAEESISLINNEDSSFGFSFAEMSCHAPGNASRLIVEPMHGTIPAKSSLPVKVRFTPSTDKEVNFNLICNIKRKTTALTLNVKAEGYSMDVIVMCEDSTGNKIELSSSAINKINFGDVEVNERAIRNIFIVNAGKFNFDYTFELHEQWAQRDNIVGVSPITGGVPHGDRTQSQISFCPPKPMALRSCHITLKISNGPSYALQASGNGVMPGLAMSFTQHNFGACFIHRAGMPVHSTTLRLTNSDKREISVDCLYPSSKQLHHDFQAQVISPGSSVNVDFTFYPREAKRYHENVVFEINGLSKQTVEFIGLGTEMKVEVADPKHKIIKFGALRVGQQVKKIIPIVNNSPAPITFHLGMTPSNILLQDKSVLKLLPLTDIVLPPKGGTAKVEVVFSPKSRIPQFTEEVLLECAGLFQPLFVITGACQGIEIRLDTDAIPFGAVVQKSSSARKLVMANSGDIGARFKWDVKKFAPDFSIVPVEGYISPGMEVPFDVTFHPQEISNDIRYESLRCSIEGAKPLRLTLTGTCVAVPPSKEVIHFTAHVRHKESKNILVANRTNQHWNLRPIIDGECWSGPDTFSVEPQTTKPYELVYHPMIMTSEGKKHMGTVFFPLPDGTGLLYNVSGTAEPPKVNHKITRDVPCKTSYTELLSVQNWLKKPQRFRIKTECIRPDKLDPGTTVKGLDYIDVPGNTKRDYKITFYAHKEGQSLIKVVFLNEQTGEYQFYEVTFRAIRPGIINTIDLVTPVRQSVPYTITLENPLSYAVTFAATCNQSEILMPNQLSVPANSEGAFNFEYLPLKVGEQQSRLEFLCNDLGLYMFDLNLKATQAGPERALYFRTCLGTSQMHTAKFLNFAKQKTDYACKVDNSDFHVDKTVAAAPGSSSGTEVVVEVTYEPSRIGESRGLLTVSSSSGGDYTFPLFGTCVAPKPQGPFIIKAGSTTSITFRNVFQHTTPFVFQVDNPLFHVTKPGENVRSKKDHRVVVGFDGNDSGSKAAVMGKLTISCAKSAGGFTNAQWVFYLKGITPDR